MMMVVFYKAGYQQQYKLAAVVVWRIARRRGAAKPTV
jgi:hypothetical protein